MNELTLLTLAFAAWAIPVLFFLYVTVQDRAETRRQHRRRQWRTGTLETADE